MINLSIPDIEAQLRPRITVVGVGGAGGNAVNNMIKANLEGVEFLVCNTDSQALAGNQAAKKIQLGVGITQGLGAGSRPDIGRAAAEEALEELIAHLEGAHMVFITAGMGGGTGTGAAPVIARAAREQNILTVGVVTRPFHFEGAHRMRIAEAGLNELQTYVDTLIVIPNQNLFRIANEKTTFADAFKMADDVLHSGVRGVTDLMVMPGLINLDFADIRTVMSEMGKAMMGTGESEGDRRSVLAAEAAISNPLLDDVSMKGARGVLINITGGLDMTLYEVDEAANRIRDEVDPDANIIFGSTFDESMQGKVRVSVVATGIDLESSQMPRPQMANLSVVAERPRAAAAGAARREPAASLLQQPGATVSAIRGHAAAQPMEETMRPASIGQAAAVAVAAAAAAAVARPEPEPEPEVASWREPEPAPMPPPPRHQALAEAPRAERREGAFIPPRPVAPPRPAAVQPHRPTVSNPYGEGEPGNPGRLSEAKKRGANIFRKMTTYLLDDGEEVPEPRTQHAPAPAHAVPPRAADRPEPRMPAPPAGRPASAPAAAQPRLTGIDVGGRGPLPSAEDDQLEIPAFLRRQAN